MANFDHDLGHIVRRIEQLERRLLNIDAPPQPPAPSKNAPSLNEMMHRQLVAAEIQLGKLHRENQNLRQRILDMTAERDTRQGKEVK